MSTYQKFISAGITLLGALIIFYTFFGPTISVLEGMRSDPKAAAFIDSLAAVDSLAHAEFIALADSLTIEAQGLPIADYLTLMRVAAPVSMCNSEFYRVCFGTPPQECKVLMQRAFDQCAEAQLEIMPEFLSSVEDERRICQGLSECACGLYSTYHAPEFKPSPQCQTVMREAIGELGFGLE